MPINQNQQLLDEFLMPYQAFVMTKSLYQQLEIPEKRGSITEEEAKFIFDFLIKNKIKKTLEVGFGNGCSTAYIISATKDKHYAIDPFENMFSNLGLENIKNLKLDEHLIFENDFSHSALPKLLKKGVKIDFAFIDGNHQFDSIFIDFYFIDLLLNHHGYVLFHDSWMRSTQHVISWIKNNKKNYRIVKTPVKSLILVQKKEADNREWNHFKGFCILKLYLKDKILDLIKNK